MAVQRRAVRASFLIVAKASGISTGQAFDTCTAPPLTTIQAWMASPYRAIGVYVGYVSGVYENLNLGARDLAGVYSSSAYARPDALWIARYDGDPALTGWAGIADRLWAARQRAKQYPADFTATYGGVPLAIDADNWDAPVATTAFTYQATAAVRARRGPGPPGPLVRLYPKGASLSVACQAPGPAVGTTTVWDKLNNGSYVTDYYVSTPSKTGYSPPVTRCLYPYQVIPARGANERSGPGIGYPVTGVLPAGALAWLFCQKAGSKVASTPIWDKIDSQHWVSDNWVATPGTTGYSKPAPRC